MSLLDFINPFNKVVDLISEVVEDPDKRNEIEKAIKLAAEETYRLELNTKTVPWVDAIHKMGRQILSILSLVIPAVLIYYQPTIDPLTLAAMTAPGGVYNYIKGKGK